MAETHLRVFVDSAPRNLSVTELAVPTPSCSPARMSIRAALVRLSAEEEAS